ncbi:hypothetical protein [Bradyrhizobium sp.]|uniref:hypothetical protein n=1 Tax=Bradyrhizobium sp. TaxID=376 RepID=UPI002639A1B0|nr:hypothetical protein [Bradyrhizobium sp.]
MRFAAIAVASLLFTGTCFAEEESVYTATHGPNCRERSREYVGAWICPGPSGYVAEFHDEGNLAAVAIRSARQKPASAAYRWRGRGKVFGDMLEWRLVDGFPSAAVLRIWRGDLNEQGEEREVQELVVFKITSSGFCRVGSIDTRRPGANEAAQQRAMKISGEQCADQE